MTITIIQERFNFLFSTFYLIFFNSRGLLKLYFNISRITFCCRRITVRHEIICATDSSHGLHDTKASTIPRSVAAASSVVMYNAMFSNDFVIVGWAKNSAYLGDSDASEYSARSTDCTVSWLIRISRSSMPPRASRSDTVSIDSHHDHALMSSATACTSPWVTDTRARRSMLDRIKTVESNGRRDVRVRLHKALATDSTSPPSSAYPSMVSTHVTSTFRSSTVVKSSLWRGSDSAQIADVRQPNAVTHTPRVTLNSSEERMPSDRRCSVDGMLVQSCEESTENPSPLMTIVERMRMHCRRR
eukprot:PhM_4_TR10821/c0_g1_i1/m.74563